MGVPAFYRQWLKNAGFRGVLLTEYPFDIVSMSIDMNGLIHKAASIVYNYGDNADPAITRKLRGKKDSLLADFYLTFFNLLMNVVNVMKVISPNETMVIKPQEVLVLAIDGVAPVAKIQQQRQRRYRNAKEKKSGPLFDSNAITPGTELMQSLDQKIVKYLQDNSLAFPRKVIYSGWNVPGEGEHKILAYMRSGEIPQGNGNHIIYGLDADLIMLSLVSPLNRIFLVREDVRDVISIDALREGLQERMKTSSAIEDFVLMMFLLGNDFLPKIFAFSEMSSSIDALIETYSKLGISLSKKQNNVEIDFPNLKIFLSALVPIERNFLETMSRKVYTYPSYSLNNATTITYYKNQPPQYQFDFNKFRNFWYMEALGPQTNKTNIEATKTLILLNDQEVFTSNIERVKQMNINYLNGLAWSFSYYMEGDRNINPQYIYLYYSAPLIHDLSRINLTPLDWILSPELESFNVVQQLISVIPPASKNLIPRKWRYLYEPTSPIYDTFIEDFEIYREAVDKDWLGHALLPPMEPPRIIDVTRNLNIPQDYLSQNYYIMIRETYQEPEYQGPEYQGPEYQGGESRGRSYRGRGYRGSESRGRGYQSSESRGRGYRGAESRGRGYQSSESRGRGYRGSESRGRGYQSSESQGRGYQSSESRGRRYQSSESRGRGYQRRVPQSPISRQTYEERISKSEAQEWEKKSTLI